MRRPIRPLALAGLAAGLALALTGCSPGAGAPPTDGDGLRIVTTTTQVTDFASKVAAGTDATITPLLRAGQSVHGFEANAADLVALSEADVVIASGFGLEAWLDDTLAAAGFTGTVIDASAGFEAAGGDAETATETAGLDGHDHADDGHDHAGDGHDHAGAGNPHIWTSPRGAALMTANIAEGLAAVDPDDAASYRAAGDAYAATLEALDGWIASNVATVPEGERLLVTNHDALAYFDADYGITFVGSIMPGWDDAAEPSAADIDALIAAIRQSGVRAIFTETQLNDATATRIAAETGAQVFSGDRALCTDSLGPEGSAQATYVGATVHNTLMLMESWGRQASPPPAELQGA